ncbi:MAG: right-handed parallel beta-helix repeat-containing protein [Myxococcota bacterium]
MFQSIELLAMPPHSLSKCEISFSPGHGVLWTHTTHHNEVINSKIHHNGNNWNNAQNSSQGNCYIHGTYIGVHFFPAPKFMRTTAMAAFFSSTDDVINNNLLDGNIVHDNSTYRREPGNPSCFAPGILMSSGTGNIIAYNNIVYREPYGIRAGYQAKNTLIANNTMYDCTYGAVAIDDANTSVFNNIGYQTGSTPLHDNGTGTVQDKTFGAISSVNAKLTTLACYQNSSAIDAGLDLNSHFTTDSKPCGANGALG